VTDSPKNEERAPSDQKPLIDAAWKQAEKVESTQACASGSTKARLVEGLRRRNAPVLPEGLPGYSIVGEIHRGGQGVVYQAVQESTGRTVAIKVMLSGAFAGPSEKLRFEREVQILARLKHPNIVTIHDSGIADTAAFFVMDYIEGEQLDDYVRHHCPAVRDRLVLFAKICNAVNVAHLRGVIHRDLKPGNIRVDAAGEPHVLDFGLAKQAQWDASSLDVHQAVTMTGQFVGSLPWASPEQAAGRMDETDLRTDVYSLGLMLYQLLTGSFPYDVSGSLSETTHNITHCEPRNPRSLNADLDDEIATIALKALRKERDLRYQTAGALGRDIQRYLTGEPIEAKRDSFSYILRKQFARHKATVRVIAAFLVLITTGFGVSLTFWGQAATARNAEAQQRRLAVDSEALALKRADEAAAEAAKARAVTDFLVEMLGSASPKSGESPDVTVREIVDEAARRVDGGRLSKEPAVETAVRQALGTTYGALGLYDESVHHLELALRSRRESGTDENLNEFVCRMELAKALRNQGKLDDAEKHLQAVLEEARRRGNPQDLAAAQAFHALAGVARDRGQLEEAEQYSRQAVEIQRQNSDTPPIDLASSLNDFAIALETKGDVAGALPVLEEAHALFQETLGPAHHDTAVALSNLAGLYKKLGNFDESKRCYLDALDAFRHAVGEEHPSFAGCMNAYGMLLVLQKDPAKGHEVLQRALELRRSIYGNDHAYVAGTINNLAITQYQLGNLAGAAASYREALDIYTKARGADHPSVATIKGNLAAVLRAKGDYSAAESMLREVVEAHRANYGAEHHFTATALSNLGTTLMELHRFDEAEPMMREALRITKKIYPADHPAVADVLDQLAELLRRKGNLEEAETSSRRTLELYRSKFGEEHASVAAGLSTLGSILSDRGDPAEAEQALSQAVAMAEQTLGPDHWRVADMRSRWGRVLSMLGRKDEAERELTRGAELLLTSRGREHPTTRAMVEQLVSLFEQAGRQTDAANWRARLATPR